MRQSNRTSLLRITCAAVAFAASADAQLEHQNIYGLVHAPLGVATVSPPTAAGEPLVISNIGSSGEDGVRIHLTEGDAFLMESPLDPAMPVGSSIRSEFHGTVAGVPDAPAGTVGMERTATGFLATVDLSALGSSGYDVRIFNDESLVHSASGLLADVIELQPESATDIDLECFYFAEDNVWIWLDEPVITFRDYSTGAGVDGNRIEFRPSSAVPPTTGELTVDVLGRDVPQIRILNEALGKLGSFHTGGGEAAMAGCNDCLVVSNIGESGSGELTISNIGASGDEIAPSVQEADANIFLFTDADPGARMSFSATFELEGDGEATAGPIAFTKLASGQWESTGYSCCTQVLVDNTVVHESPTFQGSIILPELPAESGGDWGMWLGGDVHASTRGGVGFKFAEPVLVELVGVGTFLADEIRVPELDASAVLAMQKVTVQYSGFSSPSPVTPIFQITSESSLLGDNYCVATPNSTGAPAQIFANGSTSVAANDLILKAGPVPNQFGVFFYGPNQAQVPFGNGNLCVGGQIHRLDVEMASDNVLTSELDNTDPPAAAGQIVAGSHWNAQAWFRDPAGGGAAFNLSDGIALNFQP